MEFLDNTTSHGFGRRETLRLVFWRFSIGARGTAPLPEPAGNCSAADIRFASSTSQASFSTALLLLGAVRVCGFDARETLAFLFSEIYIGAPAGLHGQLPATVSRCAQQHMPCG
jgi:hypothetical protein